MATQQSEIAAMKADLAQKLSQLQSTQKALDAANVENKMLLKGAQNQCVQQAQMALQYQELMNVKREIELKMLQLQNKVSFLLRMRVLVEKVKDRGEISIQA